MIEAVLSWTELPNLHPALVHFPIAFVVLALGFELALVIRGRLEWIDKGAMSIWSAAALGAWAARWAGRQAADSLVVPPSVQSALNAHADWGQYTVWLVTAIALVRLSAGLWRRAPGGGRSWSTLFLVAGLVSTGVVLRTADLGGALVFRHALAVDMSSERHAPRDIRARDERAASAPPRESHSAPILETGENGSRIWKPGPGGAYTLEAVLVSLDGGPPPGVSADWAQDGLSLEIHGSGFALLRDPCGDVQVEADLAFEGFEGTFGLAHHIGEDGTGGLFTIAVPGGRAELGTRAGQRLEILASATAKIASGPVTLAVSGAGRHFRGLVDGHLVTHGHRAALAGNRCGLFYDGSGTVRLTELRVLQIE